MRPRSRLTEGDDYSIDREGSLVLCRVWSRPDLSSSDGAELARQKIGWFRRLAISDARALLFDLSEAPRVTGPQTEQALGEMIAAWAKVGKPVAVVTGGASIQRMQLQRVLDGAAAKRGRLFSSSETARTWLASQ